MGSTLIAAMAVVGCGTGATGPGLRTLTFSGTFAPIAMQVLDGQVWSVERGVTTGQVTIGDSGVAGPDGALWSAGPGPTCNSPQKVWRAQANGKDPSGRPPEGVTARMLLRIADSGRRAVPLRARCYGEPHTCRGSVSHHPA